MNIAAVIQGQLLQTLFQALAPSAAAPATSQASFVRWDGGQAAPSGSPADMAAAVQRNPPGPSASTTTVPATHITARAWVMIDGQARLMVLSGERAAMQRLKADAALTLAIRPTRQGDAGTARLLDPGFGAALDEAASQAIPQLPTCAGTLAGTLAGTFAGSLAANAATPQTARQKAEAARAIVGPMLASALVRQAGLAPLMADLAALVRYGVPPSPAITDAAARVLGFAPVAPDDITGETLRALVSSSGLFHEARAAKGVTPDNLKGALLALRAALLGERAVLSERAVLDEPTMPPDRRTASGERDGSPKPQPASQALLQPPLRDLQPQPQSPSLPQLPLDEAPALTVARLLDRTEAALDRLTLTQFASLPTQADANTPQLIQRWQTELPIAVGPETYATLGLVIDEEHLPREFADLVGRKRWRLKFTVEPEGLGPVNGEIMLVGGSLSLNVWAEPSTLAIMRGAAGLLEGRLRDNGFVDTDIRLHPGAPPQPRPRAGQFMDRRT